MGFFISLFLIGFASGEGLPVRFDMLKEPFQETQQRESGPPTVSLENVRVEGIDVNTGFLRTHFDDGLNINDHLGFYGAARLRYSKTFATRFMLAGWDANTNDPNLPEETGILRGTVDISFNPFGPVSNTFSLDIGYGLGLSYLRSASHRRGRYHTEDTGTHYALFYLEAATRVLPQLSLSLGAEADHLTTDFNRKHSHVHHDYSMTFGLGYRF